LGQESTSKRVLALAGGVGGAKMAHGLEAVFGGDQLTVVVNTADDFDHLGLWISPDLDTVMYTLAGIENPETGWGIAGDTRITLDALATYGEEPWFLVGDRDFATHIYRTVHLARGESLSQVTAQLAASSGVRSSILPMCEEPVATMVDTPAGRLAFQDYFVARRQQDDVLGVSFAGIDQAKPAAGVIEAFAAADVIVFCPSNPIVSIGPILAVPGIRRALGDSGAYRIAVSPIIGGKALKGPADRMLQTLGIERSAAGVAGLYQGLIDAMVIDTTDADLAPVIRKLGIEVLVTDTIMSDPGKRKALAMDIASFADGRS
jgi:LPPG:FO 2-phospho-L-lactate transferase